MERLGAQDLSMVLPDDFGWPQDIRGGGWASSMAPGCPPPAAGSRLRRERVGCRLHLLPRFRQVLYTPRRGLGWPLWADAPAFDIADHVAVVPLGAPADEAQLLVAGEELWWRRLDRSRPLWRMWFLPGLAGAQVGVVMKVHHAIADGVAGVAARGAPGCAGRTVPAGSRVAA